MAALALTGAGATGAAPTATPGADAQASRAAATCGGARATIVGSDRPERISGTGGRDVIAGNGGGDEIAGGGGNDLICGGAGTDSLLGSDGRDQLRGGGGRDVLNGGGGRDTLRGQQNADYLLGGDDGDRLIGGPSGKTPATGDIASFAGGRGVVVNLGKGRATGRGRDTLRGVEGVLGSFVADRIYGNRAANSLSGGNNADFIAGGRGADLIGGGPFGDRVRAGKGDDTVLGASGSDDLRGGPGADTMEGYAGNDLIDGGRGSDPLLAGDADNDRIFGRGGDDVLFGDYQRCDVGNCDAISGDDRLDGGTGGETDGDRGDGGPHKARGDRCVNLESRNACESASVAIPKPGKAAVQPLPAARRRTAFSFAAPSLYPRFSAARRFYVARCESGRLALRVRGGSGVRSRVTGMARRSGSYRAVTAIEPGHDLRIRMEGGRVKRSYQVRCLPEGFPAWSFRKLRRFPPGLIILGSVPGRGHPPFVAIFDHDGVPRWWIRSSTRALNAQILSNGTIVWSRGFGDGYGRDKRMGQEIRTLGGRLVRVVRMKRGITDPHELWEDRNGNILIESYVPRGPVDLSQYGGPSRAQVVSPRIEVQSARGKLLDSLNLAQRITPRDTRAPWWPVILRSPRPGTGGLEVFDITHLNSIEPWRNQFVLSTRHTDAVFGISRRTGAVRWKLGGNKTPRSLRVIGAPFPNAELFGGQHDARIYGKRTLTVFDNATLRDRAPSGAVYRLDLKNRTARFVRRLVDPVAPRGNCCGSMRMIRGGWLVGFGDTPLTTGFTGKGKVAFRLRWSNSYRAVPVQPGAVTLRRLGRGLERLEDVPPPRPLR